MNKIKFKIDVITNCYAVGNKIIHKINTHRLSKLNKHQQVSNKKYYSN